MSSPFQGKTGKEGFFLSYRGLFGIKVMSAFPSSIAGKISYAESLKEEGNAFFKAGELRKARSCYTKVFAFTRGLPGSTFDKRSDDESFDSGMYLNPSEERITPLQEKQCVALELSVRLNMATIFIKEKKGRKAVEESVLALERDSESWKAHMRHGQGKALLHDWESARFSFLRAKKLAPAANTDSIAAELSRVVQKQKIEDANAKAIQMKRMAKAFGRGDNGDDDTATEGAVSGDKQSEKAVS